MEGPTAPPGRYHNETLERAFRILEVLGDAERGLSVSEVGRRAGLHRATAHRFLINLAEMGYARRDPVRGTYWIGFNLARFGLKSRVIGRIVQAARPALRRLSGEFGCMAALSSLEGAQVLLCETAAPPDAPQFPFAAGDYVNAAGTAAGRVLLGLRGDAEVLRRCRLQPRAGASASDASEALLRAVREARRRNIAVVEEEGMQHGFRALAVPLLNPAGRATCALSLIGTPWRLPPARDAGTSARVAAAAAEVVADLVPETPVPQGGASATRPGTGAGSSSAVS